MSDRMPASAMRLANEAVTNFVKDRAVWLVVLTRGRAEATAEECALCGGLRGAIMFPELSSIGQETLVETVDEHEHYKSVDVEVFRVKAHTIVNGVRARVVPDEDLPFTAPKAGLYSIGVYDDHELLLSVNIGAMADGATLSTLTVSIGEVSESHCST